MSRRLQLLTLGIALAFPRASLFADEFSLERLRAGEEALRARRVPEAVDQLRIACFGLLDQAEPLSECLVNLTLALEAARRPADVETTLNRFLEAERRFAAYAKADLSRESRREFEALILGRVPVETIVSVPSLATVALHHCRELLDKLAKVGSEEWTSHPELFADLFVCQVETKDWKGAQGAWPKIPEELRKRADVARAAQALAGKTGRPPQ